MSRSEFNAHQHLNPQTLQAMRNLSALQRMRSGGWTVGNTFTHPGKGYAPISIEQDTRMLSVAILRAAGAICAAGGLFLFFSA